MSRADNSESVYYVIDVLNASCYNSLLPPRQGGFYKGIHGFLVVPDYPEQQRGVAWKQVELECIWSRTAFVWTDSGLEPGIRYSLFKLLALNSGGLFFARPIYERSGSARSRTDDSVEQSWSGPNAGTPVYSGSDYLIMCMAATPCEECSQYQGTFKQKAGE